MKQIITDLNNKNEGYIIGLRGSWCDVFVGEKQLVKGLVESFYVPPKMLISFFNNKVTKIIEDHKNW